MASGAETERQRASAGRPGPGASCPGKTPPGTVLPRALVTPREAMDAFRLPLDEPCEAWPGLAAAVVSPSSSARANRISFLLSNHVCLDGPGDLRGVVVRLLAAPRAPAYHLVRGSLRLSPAMVPRHVEMTVMLASFASSASEEPARISSTSHSGRLRPAPWLVPSLPSSLPSHC